jgi:ABC-type polysaccharide/polyol phosphate export permease
MATIASPARPPRGRAPLADLAPLGTLARRRFALTARTPRELLVPLLTPVLFAVVIAPALDEALGGLRGGGVSYASFVAIATVGLLIPLNTMLAGIGVILDRESGAQRELLAAPIRRPLVVLGNLCVALAVTGLQVVVLIAAATLRGVDFSPSATGVLWFAASAALFAVGMYGVAETLANRVSRQEEYVGTLPAIAIVPWFFAGSLFPIGALPLALTWFAKILPLTHALALMRYGLLDDDGAGLRDIWGMSDPTVMALLSLGVVAAFAAAFTGIAIRVFTRSALR